MLDLTMRGVGVDEVAATLRTLRPDIKLVLSSGLDVPAARAAAGDLPFIRKPYTSKQLLDALAA